MIHVELYVQPNCQPCKATQRWLNQRHIEYVTREAAAFRDFLRLDLGHMTAPVVVVYKDGAHYANWSGHNPSKLHKHLGGPQ